MAAIRCASRVAPCKLPRGATLVEQPEAQRLITVHLPPSEQQLQGIPRDSSCAATINSDEKLAHSLSRRTARKRLNFRIVQPGRVK
ncbi:hypothetical protein [Mesorhizobium sp. M1406]|uniref:hypothetical protein n=1 Tax=Mesorhizobium sp. M1406 TaxID=2957099 RepID=UPI00333579AB